MRICAEKMGQRELNEKIREAAKNGTSEILLEKVNGHRYIGAGLSGNFKVEVDGVAGNDLAAFMNGPTIEVDSNAQDVIGNTMNSGKVVIHGHTGDIVGHSMRGGKIFIEGNTGYRAGIHMKAYRDLYPVLVVGGKAGDFLGEYMAGGLIILLGENSNDSEIVGNHVGTGMHGGEIYVRGSVPERKIGEGVKSETPNEKDEEIIKKYLKQYSKHFDAKVNQIRPKEFTKLRPKTHRPYGKIYAY